MKRTKKLLKLYSIKQDIDLLKELVSYQLDQINEYNFSQPENGKAKIKVKTKF